MSARILVALLLGACALFVQGQASAQVQWPECYTSNGNSNPSKECAAMSVRAYLEYYSVWRGGTPYTQCGPYQYTDAGGKGRLWGWTQSASHGGNCPVDKSDTTIQSYPLDVLCNDPADSWDQATFTCVEAGPSDEECLALNSEPGFIGVGDTTRNFDSHCAANGCKFEAVNPAGQTAVVSVGGTPVAYTSTFEWTGACSSPPAPEAIEPEQLNANNTPPQYCVPGTSPQMCIKNDGQHCISASTGKQLCWRPGETGVKYTGDTAQKRVPGTDPATPPAAPEGETLVQGDSVTATTTKGSTAVTTTTTNFSTAGGTEAGDVDQGEPADGTGSPQEGEGTEDSGSVTGGEGCETPPAVQGDPLLANIILQTWGTRCAALDANAVTSTGEIGDCSSAFTVTGPADDANVQKLKGIRAQICGKDANGDGQPDWTEGDAPETPGDEDPEVGPPTGLTVGEDLLDLTGILGAQACPQLGVLDFGALGSFDMDAEPFFCDLVTILRAIVLLMAAFTAIRILMGG